MLTALGCDSRTPVAEMSVGITGVFGISTLDVTVDLDADPGEYELDGDEHVWISFRGERMEATPGLEPFVLVARFRDLPTEAALDEELVLTFERPGEGSTDVVAHAPSPFVLSHASLAPASDAFEVTWSPVAAERMGWFASGCWSDASGGPIPQDEGRLLFPKGVLSGEPTYECTVELTFDRTRVREPASDFRTARTTIRQERSTLVTFTP